MYESLEHFNACAEINGWDEATKCRFMGVRLKNNAYKVYKELEAAVNNFFLCFVELNIDRCLFKNCNKICGGHRPSKEILAMQIHKKYFF
jgi:hypothetical protein